MLFSPLDEPALGRAPVVGRGFYQRPTPEVARSLLGTIVVRDDGDAVVAIRITETEAYLGPDDRAAHTWGGRRTPRVRSMWGDVGHAYVYLIYGIHHCLNLVTGGPNRGEAVLIRGGRVVTGDDAVAERRGRRRAQRRWTDGPGKLCQALAITREDDGIDVCRRGAGLWLVDDGRKPAPRSVAVTPRIGVDYAGEAATWPLRFIVTPNVIDGRR
jgi:DNA-3-methyladenine glycosylase